MRKIGPFFIPSLIINLAPGQISMKYGMKGPNFSPVSACATGNHSIGDAMIYIERGMADVMVTGGCEATITPLGVGGFCAARALSERNDAPEKASRPFDKHRDGFVAGEGSGLLILEEYEHAKKRGARIYAELVGLRRHRGREPHHLSGAGGGGRAARDADGAARRGHLPRSGRLREHPRHLDAAGRHRRVRRPSTSVFGEHAKKGLMVSSTKSMTGHLLGAAGGLEAVVTVLALARGVLPPTINVEEQDPECQLDVIPNQAPGAPGRLRRCRTRSGSAARTRSCSSSGSDGPPPGERRGAGPPALRGRWPHRFTPGLSARVEGAANAPLPGRTLGPPCERPDWASLARLRTPRFVSTLSPGRSFVTRWGSPVRRAPPDVSMSEARPEGRLLLAVRSAAAPVVLAVTTVAALAGAVLALLPAAVRGRPAGRVGPKDVEDAPDSDTAGEPLAR